MGQPETKDAWREFDGSQWKREIDVRDFIVSNVKPYTDGPEFLAERSARTSAVWEKLQPYFREEAKKGVLDADPNTPSSLTSHGPGYIDQDNEVIVGLQTDKPFRRAIMPMGGYKMVEDGIKAAGFEPDPAVRETFTKYRKTHNDAVFDLYTSEIRACRKSHIITGLPDAYGRGRIIGDYRRVALYGVDRLLKAKKAERAEIDARWPSEEVIRMREEMADQMRALADLKKMAASYGFDVGRPAANAREAVQWTYFGYLGAIKEMNGAAMSVGRVSTFFDIYIERDLAEKTLTEAEAQELIDQLVIKLRIVRFLRTPAYDALFSGDPYWATESIGGMALDGRTLVTRSSFRLLHTLKNLGPAPEPNLTVLWSKNLPEAFKRYCIATSVASSALQYENDDLMLKEYGDDYGIACCVSAMRLGKQMQFFGARVNLAKCLLYAINGGRDEMSKVQVAPAFRPVEGDILDYDDVMAKFDDMMEWLARTYVHAMNCIHYAHDRYNYERLMMALHDRDIVRTMAFGIAGLSVAADSLSAIKYAKVKPIRGEDGLVTDYETTGEFPMFGNNDPRVDDIAADLVKRFMNKLRKHPTYRGAIQTQSVLTITSNVVYGKGTGNTPDGRREGAPFAPGANPMHGRDSHGWLASCLSVAHLPYEHAQDGISYTLSVVPAENRQGDEAAIGRAVTGFDMYFGQGGHHMNLNVLSKETLLDAMDNPDIRIVDDLNLYVGRKEFDTPYINGHDNRMTPNTFEAITLQGKAKLGENGATLKYGLGYFDKIKERNLEDFVSMSEDAGANVERGVFTAGGLYQKGDFSIGAIDYYSPDIINIAYAEAKLGVPITDKLKPTFALQFTDQRSVGDDLLQGDSFSVQQVGFKADVPVGHALFTAAFTHNTDGADMREPWSGYAGYTSAQVEDFIRAGESAFLLQAGYEFPWIEGLRASVAWFNGLDPDGAGQFAQDECDFDVQWAPSKGVLKGLSLRFRYAIVEQHGGAADYLNEIRVIGNYTINF